MGLLYLITFGSLVGFVAYGWLLHNAPVSLTSTYAYVNPVVAVFLGYFLAGEALNGRTLIAAAIIIGSVISDQPGADGQSQDGAAAGRPGRR